MTSADGHLSTPGARKKWMCSSGCMALVGSKGESCPACENTGMGAMVRRQGGTAFVNGQPKCLASGCSALVSGEGAFCRIHEAEVPEPDLLQCPSQGDGGIQCCLSRAHSGKCLYARDGALSAPIWALDLSVRAHTLMDKLGVNTVEDLTKRTAAELLAKRSGQTTLREIEHRLACCGLRLRAPDSVNGQTPPWACNEPTCGGPRLTFNDLYCATHEKAHRLAERYAPDDTMQPTSSVLVKAQAAESDEEDEGGYVVGRLEDVVDDLERLARHPGAQESTRIALRALFREACKVLGRVEAIEEETA